MIFYVVELLDDLNVDVPSWKYPRNLESPRVSSPGFGNDSKMMVMFSLQSDSRRTLIWRAPGTRYHQEKPLNDTVTVVQDGSFWEELFLVPDLTCMFRV
ncbi:DDE_3 domain-containing protein [Trichonephila clavipes]|nr:DDE_3 domain-containing protein [Trichonephila clavipes]